MSIQIQSRFLQEVETHELGRAVFQGTRMHVDTHPGK